MDTKSPEIRIAFTDKLVERIAESASGVFFFFFFNYYFKDRSTQWDICQEGFSVTLQYKSLCP